VKSVLDERQLLRGEGEGEHKAPFGFGTDVFGTYKVSHTFWKIANLFPCVREKNFLSLFCKISFAYAPNYAIWARESCAPTPARAREVFQNP
jgi:hypothetical protein